MEVRVSPGVGLRGGLPLHIYESRVLYSCPRPSPLFFSKTENFSNFTQVKVRPFNPEQSRRHDAPQIP
jgi:hypothetical protein